MPTFIATAPDGTKYRVTAPEGATQAEIQAKVARQHRVQRPRDALDAPVIAGISTRQARDLGLGAVEFVSNLAHLASDPLNRKTYGQQRGDEKNRQDYQALNNAVNWVTAKTGGNPSEGWRTAGQVAASMRLPMAVGPRGAGLANAGGRALVRGGTGALAGAGVRLPSPETLAPAMGMGALTNVLIPPALSWAATTRPAKALTRQGKRLVEAGQRALGVSAPPPPRLPAPQPQTPAATLGGRRAQARAARLEKVGVRAPTTGMVTRDPAVWTAERQLAKTAEGAPVQQAYQAAYGDIAENAQGIVRNLGGAPGKESAGIATGDVLEAKNRALQEEIRGLYTQAQAEFGDKPISSLDNLWGTMADPSLQRNTKTAGMAREVSDLLKDYGVIDDAGFNTGRGLTVAQSDTLRKFINDLGNGADPTVVRARKMYTDALDTDVLDGMGGQPYAQARAAAKARFEEFKNTLAGNVAGGKVAPERLTTRLMSPATPLADLRKFNQSLMEGTGDAGVAASQSLQAQLADDLFSKGITREGDNVGLTPKRLVDTFEQNAPRYRELLPPSVYKDVRRTVYAARDVASDPALSYVNHSNTASALQNGPAVGGLFAPAPGPSTAARVIRPVIGATVGTAAGGLLGGPAGAALGLAAGGGATAAFDKYLERKAADYLAGQAQQAVSPQLAASTLAQQIQQAMAAERDRQLRMAIQNRLGSVPVSGALGAASIK